MTLSEFKAWFQGYTEAIGGAPTEAQWERIKTVLANWPAFPRGGVINLPDLKVPENWKYEGAI